MNRCVAGSMLGSAALAAFLSLGFSSPQQTASPASAAPQAVKGGKSLAPYVTWWGPDSAVKEPTFVKVTSADAWTSLWEKHTGGPLKRDNIQRPVGLPTVDFDQCMVVAIFNGRRHNTNGVIIESIVEMGDRIVVHYDESTYQVAYGLGAGEKPPAIPELHPFGIFVLPKSDKPIEIEENVQGMKNEPAKWKPRAKL